MVYKKGLAEYYTGSDLSSIEGFIRDRGAYLFTEISIDRHRYGYLADLDIGSWWVRSTVICYARVQNGFVYFVYEYWVVDRYGGGPEVMFEVKYIFLLLSLKDQIKNEK